jgi:hypothetical protein
MAIFYSSSSPAPLVAMVKKGRLRIEEAAQLCLEVRERDVGDTCLFYGLLDLTTVNEMADIVWPDYR